MGMTRVWNITDDPSTDVPVQNLVVLGKLLRPGQSIQVDEADLKTAHKTKKNVKSGLLAIGKSAPSYLKQSLKATLPVELVRGHNLGKLTVNPEVKAEEPKKTLIEEKTYSKDEIKGFGRSKR